MATTKEAKTPRGSAAQHARGDRSKLRAVLIHPELHKQLLHEMIDSGDSLQECVHKHLSRALGRKDLLLRDPRDSA